MKWNWFWDAHRQYLIEKEKKWMKMNPNFTQNKTETKLKTILFCIYFIWITIEKFWVSQLWLPYFWQPPLFPQNARAHPALGFNGTCHYKAARGGGEGGLSLLRGCFRSTFAGGHLCRRRVSVDREGGLKEGGSVREGRLPSHARFCCCVSKTRTKSPGSSCPFPICINLRNAGGCELGCCERCLLLHKGQARGSAHSRDKKRDT